MNPDRAPKKISLTYFAGENRPPKKILSVNGRFQDSSSVIVHGMLVILGDRFVSLVCADRASDRLEQLMIRQLHERCSQ